LNQLCLRVPAPFSPDRLALPTGRKKRVRPKQDGKKADLELWKNVGYEMENGRADFIGNWLSKDDTNHRMTTYIHTYILLGCRLYFNCSV
jgi:hypothetical protein